MNIRRMCEDRISEIRGAVSSGEALIETIETCRDKTLEFLALCEASGITNLAIERSHESVPASINFAFGERGSVFSNEAREDGWPAIWRCVVRAGINGGAGNGNQHQLSHDHQLLNGVYELKDGKWKMLAE